MLSHLWRKKIGSGIIDVNVDPYSQTLSAGDVNGESYIFDYFGTNLAEFASEMPVWGVFHQSLKDGRIIHVCGHADKQKMLGHISAYSDDEPILNYETDEPIWDVCILENSIVATGWGGSLYLIDLPEKNLRKKIDVGHPLYGLSKDSETSVLINADRAGVFRYSVSGEVLQVVSLKNNSYNIAYSPSHKCFLTGTHGPYLFATSEDGRNIAKIEGRDAFSVSAFGSFILTGNKEGDLTISSIHDVSRSIYKSNQGAEIWNIACDVQQGHIFLALGDGTVSCFNLELDSRKAESIDKFILQSKDKKDLDIFSAIDEALPDAVILPYLLEGISSDSYTEDDVNRMIQIIDSKSGYVEENYGTFIKSILCFAIGEHAKAVEGLQVVDASDSYYGLAVILLSRALISLGDSDSARQYLATNMSGIDKQYIPDAMSILEELGYNPKGEPVSPRSKSIAPSYTSLVEESKRKEIFSLATKKNSSGITSTSLDYGVINYIKYEYPNRSDHAKKIFEKNVVETFLMNTFLPKDGKPVSLDIGCATCRYPLWLAANGFFAVGYDIDDDAVKICKMRSEGNENVRIEKKNILDHEPETNVYSLVTCMMGTFNHIPSIEQGNFIRWVFESLKPGGAFVFSSWNNSCPYTTHLHFYNREEREYIKKNTKSLSSIEGLLKDSGFLVEKSVPIAFLPDECYEAWLGELSESEVIEMDERFSQQLTGSNSQMYVFCAIKA